METADRRSRPGAEGKRPFPGCPDGVLARAAGCLDAHIGLQRTAWITGALRALDVDDARSRGRRSLCRHERVPRATIGNEPTYGERAGLSTRKGWNSQRERT